MWISFDSFPIGKFAKLSPVPGSRSRGQRLTTKGERMKQKRIIYKNKPIYLPFADADYGGDGINELETITNPFSGQSIDMPKFAVAVYDVTMGSNQLAELYDKKHGMGTSSYWKTVRKGLDWFRKYFAEEYMVLLD